MKIIFSKRALILSAVAVFLCISMLIGTTYAWFSDSVTSNGNIIKSGTLEVSMEWADGKDDPASDNTAWTDASTGAIFDYELWEPGFLQVRHLAIANEGNLALKYQLQIAVNGEVDELADVIDVYFIDPAEQIDARTDLDGKTPVGTLRDFLAGANNTVFGHIEAGEKDTVTVALKMREDAGNEYQNKQIGASFSLILLATQYTSESDSIDNQYDVNAEFPVIVFEAVTADNVNNDITVVAPGTGVAVTIPAADTAEGDVYKLEVTNVSAEQNAAGETTVSLEAELFRNNVKIENSNTVYDLTFDLGTGALITSVKHNDTELTEGNGDQQYEYDAATGILTIHTSSFSPFTVTYTNPEIVAIKGTDTVIFDTLGEFRDSVNAGNSYEGYTVTLNKDVDVSGSVWTPIEAFGGTFDGNGNTITGLTISAEGAIGAMFNTLEAGAALRNIKFEDVDVSGTYVAVLVGDAETTDDITIENIEIVSGTITATGYAAGIAFDVEGDNVTFRNCVNRAEIVSDYSASGIGAWVYPTNATVENLVNYGDVTGANRAGGIFGNFKGTLTDSENHGDVTSNGGMPAGGIVGVSGGAGTVIANCINTGDVTTTASNINASAAGILGQANGANTVKYCINTGDITAENSYAGGIVTALYGSSTSQYCYNSGAVIGNNSTGNNPKYAAGGIAPKGAYGAGDKSQHCLNAGTVAANTNGATCQLTYQNISDSYYYDGTALKDKTGADADLEAALEALNSGAAEAFFGIDGGVIKPLALID